MECTVTDIIEDTFSMILLFREKQNKKSGDWTGLRFELPKTLWNDQIKKDTIFLRFPKDKFLFMK